jgi:orotate phosphoribosyltransferase
MSEAEQQLLQLLKDRSFRLAAEGETFRLASGDTSDYYIDGKMTQVHPLGAHLIGEVLYERTRDLGVDAIGGLEVGAVPMTTAAVISYHHHGRHIEGFWVRDEAKRHGTAKLIEGGLLPRSRVVIVDDVVTKGGSVIRAVAAVRAIECEVVQVLTLVDRMAGARELFRQHGIEAYQPIFTVRDLGVDPDVRRAAAVAPQRERPGS